MPPEPLDPRAIAAVVLAAGRSRRFGSAKQLALLDGRTLLEHVLERAWTAGLRPVVAVVPVWLSRPASSDPDLIWVRNPYPERGMSHSLRLGLGAVPRRLAALILLGDQPGIDAATIRAVIAARGTSPILAAFAEEHVAPPVLVERSVFRLTDGLRGDAGLRSLIEAHPELVTRVPVPRHAIDVDRTTDLAEIDLPDA
jgi:molybdenum cofactor cytidylyltransferase